MAFNEDSRVKIPALGHLHRDLLRVSPKTKSRLFLRFIKSLLMKEYLAEFNGQKPA